MENASKDSSQRLIFWWGFTILSSDRSVPSLSLVPRITRSILVLWGFIPHMSRLVQSQRHSMRFFWTFQEICCSLVSLFSIFFSVTFSSQPLWILDLFPHLSETTRFCLVFSFCDMAWKLNLVSNLGYLYGSPCLLPFPKEL